MTFPILTQTPDQSLQGQIDALDLACADEFKDIATRLTDINAQALRNDLEALRQTVAELSVRLSNGGH